MEVYPSDNNEEIVEVLFRAGYGLQAREINGVQKSLQRQVSGIGDHLFKEGSPVVGGTFKKGNASTLLVDSNYIGSQVNLNALVGRTIIETYADGGLTGARGMVIAVSPETDTDSAAIHYNDISTIPFGTGITVRTEDNTVFATIKTTESPVRECSYIRLLEGIYYHKKRFVKVFPQLLVYSKFETNYNGYVGLEFKEITLTEFTDTTLYDPARGHSNYNAPGAHRKVVHGTLATRSFLDTLDDTFVILADMEEGEVKNQIGSPELNELGDILARRTYDESGDYVKSIFKADILESVVRPVKEIAPSATLPLVANITTTYPNTYQVGDRVTITSGDYAGTYRIREILNVLQFSIDLEYAIGTTNQNVSVYRNDYFGIRVSSGKAYVKGYEIDLPSTTNVEIRRARDVARNDNNIMSTAYGQYVVVDNLKGMFDVINFNAVNLRDAGNVIIGTARVRAVELHNKALNQYRLYLFDVKMNASQNPSNISIINTTTGLGGTASVDVASTFNLVSVANRRLIYSIYNYNVATFAPDNVDSVTYTSQYARVQPSSGNVVTFNTTGNTKFLASTNVELAGTSEFNNNFIVIDVTNKVILNPGSAALNSAGTSLTLNVGVNTQVALVAKISTQPAVKTKTEAVLTRTIAAGSFTVNNRSVSLNVSDAYGFKVMQGEVDISDRFTLDPGQRDEFYDHSSLVLKSGQILPTSVLTVTVNYYNHTGSGYFSRDSYPNEPGMFVSETTGGLVDPLNALDFRPVRNASAQTFATNLIPSPSGTAAFDFTYYMPRRDIVLLTKSGEIKVVSGIPAMDPKYPQPSNDEMVLFKIDISAYTYSAVGGGVAVRTEQNRRYTMRDIGVLDKRITRLEYETALSLLESAAKQEDIRDASGLSRFKTGFIVDNFVGHALGDTTSADYRAAVDPEKNELRAMYRREAIGFNVANRSNNTAMVGNDEMGYQICKKFSLMQLSGVDIASKGVSVTPYLTTKRVGVMNMSPSSDYWVDTTTRPTRNIDMSGDVPLAPLELGTVWNEWETGWTGQSVVSDNTTQSSEINQRTVDAYAGGGMIGIVDRNVRTTTTVTTGVEIVSNVTNETRSGTTTSVSFSPVTESIGNSIVDVNLSHFMREISINFEATGMRPDTDIHVFIDNENVNSLVVSRATSSNPVSPSAAVRTDSTGRVVGTINVPAGRFRTGERLVALSDEPNNVGANATTEATFVFAASGLINTTQETTLSTRIPSFTTESVSDSRTITEVASVNINSDVSQEREATNRIQMIGILDPYAQSFWVSEEVFPYGCFVKELNLYFRRKPTTDEGPVTVQIRPSVNGFPHSKMILPMAQKNLNFNDVNIPTDTNSMSNIRATPTKVVFDVPIYLSPGEWYNFVLLANTPEYEVYTSEMGQNIIGTETPIYKQPTLGSAYRSQNGETWTAFQNDDIMHDLYICVFDTETDATFDFVSKTLPEEFRYNLLNFQPQVLDFTSSSSKYVLNTRKSDTLAFTSQNISARSNVELPNERIIAAGSSDVKINTTFNTSNKYVSPFYDLDRQYSVLIKNEINFFGLIRTGFTIANQGLNYSASPTINITGGGGAGAVVTAIVESGLITGVKVVNPGIGYTSPPTITINDATGTGASLAYRGFETDPTGGNALNRYLTKPVTLEDDFETDRADIRADLFMPAGTEVKVYVRGVGAEDTTPITQKEWVEVTNTNKRNSVNSEFVETKFNAELSYTTSTGEVFEKLKTVQAKFVLLSENTSVVPRVKNFVMVTSI